MSEEVKLCKDCKHHILQKPMFYPPHGCAVGAVMNLVTGDQILRDCWQMRADDGECGPAGKFWEPRR